MNTITNQTERQTIIENYVTRIIQDMSGDEIKSLLLDYIYDDKNRMSNVALFAEINDIYPDLLEG